MIWILGIVAYILAMMALGRLLERNSRDYPASRNGLLKESVVEELAVFHLMRQAKKERRYHDGNAYG